MYTTNCQVCDESKHKQQKMPKARANMNVYSSTRFFGLIFEDEMICIPPTARYVVLNQTETAEDAESTSEHQRLQQYAISGFPLNLSCLMVSFSCVLVYSLGNRTPESENKQTSVYLIKRKIKKENFGIRTRARETRPGAMTSSALPHGSALHL